MTDAPAAPGVDPQLRARVESWLAEDPDPETRAELSDLLAAADSDGPEADAARAELADRFNGRLEFGTAGLRGAMAAGPNRMNRVVVIRAAAGLAAYLRARGGTSVVVGYDARHGSATFARDTCAVMVGAGLAATMLPRPLPTPVLAFAIRHLNADAGVMVTASHNPPQDNGYKVYLGDGVQIVPPADAEISAAIDAVGSLDQVPRPAEGWDTLGEDMLDAYLDRAAHVPLPDTPRDLRIAYTPLHGVGRDIALAAFARAGFPAPAVVDEQAQPDPDFPTVSFPNPEEPGAIDLAIALGQRIDADLVLANDPDADRCAAAAPFPDGWRILRGDELGALLATHIATREPGISGTFACSIVSSSLLGKIAAEHGLAYSETLTGFKWIARVPGLRFGYEEALGYCVDPGGVRDKDGVTAALLMAELAATLKAEGRTIADVLDDLARRYGLHATDQLAIRVADLSLRAAGMRRLRDSPPATLGGRDVERVDDLAAGVGGLPPTDGLRYVLSGGARVVVRPSGTEPKLKCYLEVVEEIDGADVAPARAQAAAVLEGFKDDLRVALGLTSVTEGVA